MVIEKTTKPVQDVYTESRGFVRSYQVLEQRATDKSVYVRIRALVPSFESAISDAGKKRIAVLPFRVTPDGYRLADHGNAMAFSQRLADHLVTQMSKQQDVVVVNRDFFAELGLEKAVLGADAAPEELTKLGASVGADFLLVGRVQEARTETEPGRIDDLDGVARPRPRQPRLLFRGLRPSRLCRRRPERKRPPRRRAASSPGGRGRA